MSTTQADQQPAADDLRQRQETHVKAMAHALMDRRFKRRHRQVIGWISIMSRYGRVPDDNVVFIAEQTNLTPEKVAEAMSDLRGWGYQWGRAKT